MGGWDENGGRLVHGRGIRERAFCCITDTVGDLRTQKQPQTRAKRYSKKLNIFLPQKDRCPLLLFIFNPSF